MVDPGGRYLYAASASTNAISVYAIAPTSGALTLSGSPVAAGTQPTALAIDPSGQFLYAVNTQSGNVSAYTVDATTGTLTAVSGSPVAAGNQPHAIAID